MIRGLKKMVAAVLSLALMIPACITSLGVQAASGTGVGLAAHAMTAYNQGWDYQYGYASIGRVDCSGLIYTYAGGSHSSSALFNSAPEKGSISTLPRIHGLGLWQPGHVGVYVGGGMAVDARDESSNMVYSPVSSHRWQAWFKVPGIQYPDTGWVKYNGQTFYYENGQYVVNTTKMINGVSYTFAASGALTSAAPPESAYQDVSYAASGSVSSGSNSASSSTVEPQKPKELKVGMTDSEVQRMKERLSELGYYDEEITDYFGEFTGECLKKFQETAGLEVTGIADEATLNALYDENAPHFVPTYAIGDQAEGVLNVESRLSELSYFYDTPNQVYDEATASAVEEFQAVKGMEVTGACDVETLNALFAQDAPVNPEAGTMKLGVTGGCVGTLSSRMIELRYLVGEPSNTFDEALQTAVTAYQAASGTEQTGRLTKEELELLYSDHAVKSPDYDNLKLGYKGEDVQELQAKLALLDYYKDIPDGVFTQATEEAVKAYQADTQEEVTGVAPPSLRSSMDSRIQVNSMVANTEAEVIKMTNLSRVSTQPRAGGFGVSAASVTMDSDAEQTFDWLLPVMILTMVMCGTVVAFIIKNPYFVRNLGRKYRIRRIARYLERAAGNGKTAK